jgi:autotransporter passenger strand-loop-strand repeat protein
LKGGTENVWGSDSKATVNGGTQTISAGGTATSANIVSGVHKRPSVQ